VVSDQLEYDKESVDVLNKKIIEDQKQNLLNDVTLQDLSILLDSGLWSTI